MTLLYYSVKESIRTFQNAYYPADLFSASIVTFTDGEDVNTEEVAGVPLSAWTIGLQSADASDSKLFLEHLQYLVKAATPSTKEMAV